MPCQKVLSELIPNPQRELQAPFLLLTLQILQGFSPSSANVIRLISRLVRNQRMSPSDLSCAISHHPATGCLTPTFVQVKRRTYLQPHSHDLASVQPAFLAWAVPSLNLLRDFVRTHYCVALHLSSSSTPINVKSQSNLIRPRLCG